jgi:hypothetical protein
LFVNLKDEDIIGKHITFATKNNYMNGKIETTMEPPQIM